MLSLLLASGSFVGTFTAPTEPDFYDHTLRGERVLAKEVVCRNRWGTPMLPDGKGAYIIISPINPEFIALSLMQPPNNPDGMVPFRPKTVVQTVTTTTVVR